MRSIKCLATVLCAASVVACLQVSASGQSRIQSTDAKVASVRAEGMAVRFDSAIPYSSATLTVSGPDGVVYRRQFEGGTQPSFALFGKTGAALGDGQYTYELRFNTVRTDVKDRLATQDDQAGVEDEQGRTNRTRLPVQSSVQSGSFAVLNGTLYVGNETEPTLRGTSPVKNSDSPVKGPDKNLDRSPRPSGAISGNTLNRLRNHRAALRPMFDQVIPDDLIVQGSACIGLDCVNNEAFGFDTIRLKENNTRIKFDDTSTAAGFPATDWQLTANDSASGGANKFSIEDITAATVPFTITGNAPTNSIFVDGTGRVGLRTSTPVLDLHINTGNTPATRLEQNSSGGFIAQTWDIAGNEANFFVRDVTGGSRLPFRIRPGAPTSSIDINSSGQVGIGTAAPTQLLHLFKAGATDNVLQVFQNGTRNWSVGINGASDFFRITDNTVGVARLTILNNGRVGIGTNAPDQVFSVNGDASKTGANTWLAFSDERLKTIKGKFNSGLKAVMQLQPIRYEYKPDNALGLKSEGEHIGFGAQTLQKIIPEAVTRNSSGYLMVNADPIMWTMLNAIKEQQKEIVELKGQIQKLQSASHRRGTNYSTPYLDLPFLETTPFRRLSSSIRCADSPARCHSRLASTVHWTMLYCKCRIYVIRAISRT
jgi:hypothetical protein